MRRLRPKSMKKSQHKINSKVSFDAATLYCIKAQGAGIQHKPFEQALLYYINTMKLQVQIKE